MKKLLFIFIIFQSVTSHSQTWSNDVAQIVYDKCTKCHHNGGIAPFPLMTYNETSPMAAAIYDAVAQDRMPPWPPDNNYQQYVHNRALNSVEKTTIQNWILAGAPEGNAASTPPPPVYTSTTLLGNGDLTIQMPTYMSKATAQNDDYVCFAVPSGLLQNRVIRAVEIVPGNRQIVHHASIYLDQGALEVTDSIGGNCASPSNQNTKLIAGYTPGSSPMVLPSTAPLKLGIDMIAGSNIYFSMHYPAGSYGQFDSTKVILHFYPTGTSGIRQVSADPIIRNWSFNLPANQITTVTAQYPQGSGGVPANISILSVFPHMHLLGKSIKSYAITPTADTVKFANIPHWDFHWQDFYFFKHIQKVPLGSKIKGEGVYDNTATNVHNPNNPPITVTAGLNTNDEMFLVYFLYMLYQNGDENYDMEELLSASLAEQLIDDDSQFNAYPNPFDDQIELTMDIHEGALVSLFIYDYTGQLVKKVMQHEVISTNQLNVKWDGKNNSGEMVKQGVYFVSATIDGKVVTKQLVKL